MSLNSAEICVFYKQSQNLTFTNKPTPPTQPIPEIPATSTICKIMPM